MRHVHPPKQGPTLETGRHSQELYKGINNVSWGIRNVVTNHDLSNHPGERVSLLVSPWLRDEAAQCFWISWLLCPRDYPRRDSGAGCHFLLQGIFPTQGWKSSLLRLLHGQVGSLALPPLWVAWKMLLTAAGVWRLDLGWQVHFQGGSLPGLAHGWWVLAVHLFTGSQSVPAAWQRPSPRGRDPTEGNQSCFACADLIRLPRGKKELVFDLYFCIRATTEENHCWLPFPEPHT